MRTVLCSILFLGIMAPATAALAQSDQPAHEIDLAFTYNPQYRDGTNGNSFWSRRGGGGEFSADLYRGVGAVAAISINYTANINGSGVNLTTYTPVFGPRYTWSHCKVAIFGEGLVGISEGKSIFPSAGGAVTTANTFAAQAGGGVDLRLSKGIAVRPIEASWLRTGFPNGTTNVQNSLQLGVGVVFRLRH